MRYPAASMQPTVVEGETLEIDFGAFSRSAPDRWDVIAFDAPEGRDGLWVFRVVGLPDEVVEIRPDGLFIDGKKPSLPDRLKTFSYQVAEKGLTPPTREPVSYPYQIPSDGYFVLGDNVGDAFDSRFWGALKSGRIRGKVLGK